MLKLQYIPHSEIKDLDIDAKIRKILRSVKDDKIILIEGCLAALEESELIKQTMEQIDRKFKGIEICSVTPRKKNTNISTLLKTKIANLLLGKNEGMTIVGPATIVKNIKKDPSKVELLTKEIKKRRKKR